MLPLSNTTHGPVIPPTLSWEVGSTAPSNDFQKAWMDTTKKEDKGTIMKRIFVPTSNGSDWQRLLGDPKKHWKSGKSAMSTAACWEANSPNIPPEIIETFTDSGDAALQNLELLAAIPEWKVELPGGDNPSQTDVLALTRNDAGLVVLGVEAKMEETFGPTLGEKREGATQGQQERLEYLHGQLNCQSSLGKDIRYQLLHRTVSALLTAKAFHASIGVMMVQSFSPTSKWREDFDAFALALNSRQITPDLYELETKSNLRLLIGWSRGRQEWLSAKLPNAPEFL